MIRPNRSRSRRPVRLGARDNLVEELAAIRTELAEMRSLLGDGRVTGSSRERTRRARSRESA